MQIPKICLATFLAIFTTVGLFALIFVLIFHVVPETSRSLFEILLGAVVTQWSAVMGYHFGSSAGSTAKSAAIEKMVADKSSDGKSNEAAAAKVAIDSAATKVADAIDNIDK